MRIRSVKPEFWAHPVMARQSDAVRLLAIGLLNYADDEGYFFADPALVRAALRPLDDQSTIVRASLETLENMGYLETRDHPTHGRIGRVVHFDKHQRVDRPNKSSIKVLFDSTNDRRMIDDRSSLEQGAGKGREQGAGSGVYAAPAAASQLPDSASPPTEKRWIERAGGSEPLEWPEWWSRQWSNAAKIGWVDFRGRKITNWHVHQDSLQNLYRGDLERRKAVAAPPPTELTPEERADWERRQDAERAKVCLFDNPAIRELIEAGPQ